MKHLCTLADKNYLYNGLSLYESLHKNSKDFILHFLCIDNESFIKLKKHENESLVVYSNEILKNPDLQILKNSNYDYYCWCLASYFSNLLIKQFESITYIDSDVFFHKNIQLIYDEIGDKDIGMFRHRHINDINRGEGLYNVGVVYFKNSYVGNLVLDWWADAVLHRKYPELATCGDQRYLNEFPKLYPSVFIDGNIGHGSPWHWRLYDYSKYLKHKKIIWNGIEQDLVFSHFSRFKYNGDSYIPATLYYPETPLEFYQTPALINIYDEYYNCMKECYEKF